MNSRSLAFMIGVLVFTKLAVPIGLDAQEHAHYKLIDLGTFGGPQSYVYMPNNYAAVLNDQGTVAGWADTSITPDPFYPYCFNPDCYVSNAFQSLNGTISDLGALSGGVSSTASWISSDGLIAGWSENDSTDPSFPVPGIPVTHAVLWEDSVITDLKTLKDGYQSVALAVNNRGQVVGAADNGTTDPDAMFSDYYGWVTQTRAFLWQDDVMQDLGTLGGTDAVALLINDEGQIVGASYTSSAPSAYCDTYWGAPLTTGAFLYQDGDMKNIGSFGGTCTFPSDLNNRGEIVGISTLPGDNVQHAFLWKNDVLNNLPNTIGGKNAAAIALNDGGDVVGWASVPGDQDIADEQIHASLWKNGIMTDLGTLGTDPCSNGFSVNAAEQVVGVSVAKGASTPCNFLQTRAFLWQKGSMVDLNTLIPADSSLYLTSPETINDLGEIAGIGCVPDTCNNPSPTVHAFLLIPCGYDDDACQGSAAYPALPAPSTTTPVNPQNRLGRMSRNASRTGFGIASMGMSSARSPSSNSDSSVSYEAVNKNRNGGEPVAGFQFSSVHNGTGDYLNDRIDGFSASRASNTRRCLKKGMQCPPQFGSCCPGLVCAPASDRAFCE